MGILERGWDNILVPDIENPMNPVQMCGLYHVVVEGHRNLCFMKNLKENLGNVLELWTLGKI